MMHHVIGNVHSLQATLMIIRRTHTLKLTHIYGAHAQMNGVV